MHQGLTVFRDREEAAEKLAGALLAYRGKNAVVAALARGAVPMGCLLAEALEADLYVLVVRKIGAPGNPELAIGAISDGEHPQRWMNEELVRLLGVSDDYIERAAALQAEELQRRKEAYGADRRNPELAGRTVILTDDGIATGATMRIALAAVKRQDPARCVLAIPVAPPDSVAELRGEVDELVCLRQPWPFRAVGLHYREFLQVSDEQVARLLRDFDSRTVRLQSS